MALLNAVPGLSCLPPAGAFHVFPSRAGLIGWRTPFGRVLGTDPDVVTYLLEDALVATVDGAAYGLSPHLRP